MGQGGFHVLLDMRQTALGMYKAITHRAYLRLIHDIGGGSEGVLMTFTAYHGSAGVLRWPFDDSASGSDAAAQKPKSVLDCVARRPAVLIGQVADLLEEQVSNLIAVAALSHVLLVFHRTKQLATLISIQI